MAGVTDAFLVYSMVKRLAVPFKKWPAYKLGIIDASGHVLKRKATLTTPEERDAWGRYDIMIANLKKLIAKVPGGSSMIGSAAAAAFLFKECRDIDAEDGVLLEQKFNQHFGVLLEDMGAIPANNVGGGQVAALGVGPNGEPSKRTTLPKLRQIMKRKSVKANAAN